MSGIRPPDHFLIILASAALLTTVAYVVAYGMILIRLAM